MTPLPGGPLLVDRDDLHAGGLGVLLQVRHLARRALAFTSRGDAGIDYGLILHKKPTSIPLFRTEAKSPVY